MMTRSFHPSTTYTLRPWRREMMENVNLMVRKGLTYVEISKIVDRSPTTVQRYHVGFGDNCLDYDEMNQYGRYVYARDSRSVMYVGASCPV